ncbi:MAG TPA: DUF6484 domain-containing protein [Gemmatimonadales bacterium]|nr:DUF6484 domain-containing protein [Gemmatimonadales bacterium]
MKRTNDGQQDLADASQGDAEELLPSLLSSAIRSATSIPAHGAVIGTLIAVAEDGCASFVAYTGQPTSDALSAKCTCALDRTHVGRQVVLVFERGDATKPIVVGLIAEIEGSARVEGLGRVEIEVDHERAVVTAKEQLVLRCGKASITLTKSGKVLIEGAYVSTRSLGVNRIKGGSVQIN